MAVPVQGRHIERGIERYQGVIDNELQSLLTKSGLPYQTYVFNDGRVLLVNVALNFGLLYADRDEVFSSLVLEG